MEIQNNHTKWHSVKRIKKKLGIKRVFYILLLVIALSGFGLISYYFVMYKLYPGRYFPIKMLMHRIVQGDFSFVKNKLNSLSNELDLFDINIKFVKLEKLRYFREKALLQNDITNDLQKAVSANIRYNDKTYKVDISLTGQTIEHVRHPDIWSLSVKVKDGKTILGMKKFALLVPLSRGYLTDWIAHQILISRGVIGLRNNFIDVNINGKNIGIYYLEERFDKLLIESNQLREGIIFKNDGDNLKIYNLKKIKKNPELSEELVKLNKLWNSFLNNNIKTDQLFDLPKFASTVAVSDLMNQKHPLTFVNMRFYFNPVTCLIEPIAREWGIMHKETKKASKYPFGPLFIDDPNSPDIAKYHPFATKWHTELHKNPVIKKIYDNLQFIELYLKEMSIVSRQSYLDSVISYNHDKIDVLLKKIHVQNPFYEFPTQILHKNQRSIRDKIYPRSPIIEAVFNKMDNNTISLTFENKVGLPVEIHYLKYNSKIKIDPTDRIILVSNYKKVNSNRNIDFKLNNEIKPEDFSFDDVVVYYSILGINEIKRISVFTKAMTEDDYLNLNPTTRPVNINEFPFIFVNEKTKSIEFIDKICKIQKDLIIPKGYVVSAKPGCRIDLTNSAKIISYSPVLFFGKSDNLIKITSSDSTGQGIVVFNCNRISELSYVSFENLSNISEPGWNLRGAVTFYRSPININHCTFGNNLRGDDYLNVISTDFNITNTDFINVNADAFDSDFSKGTIENVKFVRVGNDAIDISGSTLKIDNIFMDNIGDKGLSAGENSQMFAKNIEITNSEIAVCSKDMSRIIVSNIVLKNNQIGFTAFQKKSEFGAGTIEGTKVEMKNSSVPYLIETHSNCTIDGKEKKSDNNRVKDILYGVKFGKSSK